MKLKYIKITNSYIDYLKQYEARIPNYDYGEGHYKPFFVCLEFKDADIVYASQITSVKPRHYKMNNDYDFIKIFKDEKLLGAINLNYMFPVAKGDFIEVELDEMQQYLNNPNASNQLRMIAEQVNLNDVLSKSIVVYKNKVNGYDNALSKRSLDFKDLEAKCIQHKLSEHLGKEVEVKLMGKQHFEINAEHYETITNHTIFTNFDETINHLVERIKDTKQLQNQEPNERSVIQEETFEQMYEDQLEL